LHLAFRNALRDARLSRTGAQSPIAVRAHMHAALPPRPLAGAIAAARSLFVVLAITVGARSRLVLLLFVPLPRTG
jgi:hypothetical protein